MVSFRCPHCGDTYDVDDELSDKVIRCRTCNEFVRVPAPPPPPPPPPQAPPPAPAKKRPQEPWPYPFIEGIAALAEALSALFCLLCFIGVVVGTFLAGTVVGFFVLLFVGLLVAGSGVLSLLLTAAVLLLFVDMGRSLRQIRARVTANPPRQD
jgi:hypothetical protein